MNQKIINSITYFLISCLWFIEFVYNLNRPELCITFLLVALGFLGWSVYEFITRPIR